MVYARRLMLLLLLLWGSACASHEKPAPPTGVITLVVMDARGWPLYGVALFAEARVYEVQGGIQLTVTGPVYLQAYKPGYSLSPRTLFYPGEREIVLYAVERAD